MISTLSIIQENLSKSLSLKSVIPNFEPNIAEFDIITLKLDDKGKLRAFVNFLS